MARLVKALFLIALLFAGPVSAQGRVRLVVMDGINLEHLTDSELPNFRFLMEHGAVGLANANTAGGRSQENTALTLGAGSRALGPGAGLVWSRDELMELGLAGDVQLRRTGIIPPPGSLVVPNIAIINEANSQLLHTVRVGYLAETLLAGGRSVAALVNADDWDVNRPAAAIVADRNGIIMGGQVGEELLSPDETRPFGLGSDLRKYLTWLRQLESTDLVVIDLGDTSRALAYSAYALEGIQDSYRFQALSQLDQLLAHLLEAHREGDLLLVVGLQANRSLGDEEGKWLVPVLAYGHDFQGGLLTSATTRRRGIVANFDVTATILQHFNLYTPGEIHGQPLAVLEASDPMGYLLDREEEMARVYKLRTSLVKGYIGVIIVLVGLSVAALLLKWRRLKLLKYVIAAVCASPLLLLLLGVISGSLWMVPVWLLAAGAAAWGVSRFPPTFAMRGLGAVTALVVAADALGGAWLQQRSILGYDAIAGARYYGIGNEFMGVLLGSTLLAVSGLLVKHKGLAAVILGAVVLLLMLPGVGANFGGTLAALLGFTGALTGFGILNNKKHRRIAVLVLAGAALALVFLNLRGSQSHVGRFFAAVFTEPEQLWLAVQRKLDMALRLVRWSLWSRAFAVLFIAAVWMLFTKRRLLARKLGTQWPHVRGTMLAALAALLLNDSGVVAAATTLLYLTLPLLYYEFSSSSWLNDSHSA